jgi:uncharacterized protein YyaL (SSP411 family)
MANRLAAERSPYLLQHADNPVDWYAWGDEAFARARVEDKPIFLSIGYSTCHWCHVMAHESFEDPDVAAVLNAHFVSIKVDREERPDLDRVYMMFVQAMTGAGGWPMSVWLTPELQPFFGGTYFPPTERWGRPGFIQILEQLARAWRNERAAIVSSAAEAIGQLRRASGADAPAPDRGSVAGLNALTTGIASFAETFDARHGGFGGAPKFPRPSELLFLLEASALTGDHHARDMALETLRAMAMGGVRDQIGGGFHRYSVDAEWRVPHFEKMLYDQAQLVLACLEAGQASGEPFYATVAEDTLDYVRRDLTSPDGAFHSAEDADSLVGPIDAGGDASHGEKREGAFYVWTAGEVRRLVGDGMDIVTRRFGIEPHGNALADPQGEFTGQNILYIAQAVDDIAARTGTSPDAVMRTLADARASLFEARSHRPRPHLDDKILAGWNGLMVAAFARAARGLLDSPRREDWRRAAERAAGWMKRELWQPEGARLFRRHRAGEAAIDAFCEDYAYVAWGAIELFQATGDAAWLEWALALTEAETARFFDARDGGWFSTTGQDASVLLRLKEDYDGAEPAAASVTVRNLLTLGHLTANGDLVDRAQRTLERYGPELGRAVRVMPFMVANVALWHASGTQVVIVGDRAGEDTRALERVVARHYLPGGVVVPIDTAASAEAAERRAALAARLPWTAAMTARDGRATAYVCRDFACREPVTDEAALDAQLADAAAPRRIQV